MNEADLNMYLRAKDKWSLGNLFYSAALFITVMGIMALYIPAVEHLAKYLLLASFLIGTSTYGAGVRGYVSRADILKVLDRQISNDPEALKYIASTTNKKESQKS